MDIQKKYVYDLITRICHAGIGATSILLWASAKFAGLFYENGQWRHLFWIIHIYCGYSLIAFISVRVIWFFNGPKYSRLSNFIELKKWKTILQTKKINWGWGHHPLAALAYLGLYAVILFLIYTGLFLARIQFDYGPVSEKYFDEMNLLKNFLENHNMASWFVFIFTIVHLTALTWHQIKGRVPVFISMKTGHQYKRKSTGSIQDEEN